VLPNGDVLELPAVDNLARLQIIHNSASPTVDIWVNDEPAFVGVEYRTATPYFDFPAGRTLTIGVAPSPSDDPSDIIADFDINLDIDGSYVAIASGLVGNATTPFTLNLVEGTREAANAAGTVDFIVNHGATDAPAVDVIARNVATIVSGAEYGDVTNYITVPANAYILDVTPAGQPNTIVASYDADLSGLGGGAAVVFASGFLAPAAGQPGFGLWVTLPDGTTFPLDLISSTKDAVEVGEMTVFPNPASDYLNLSLQLNQPTDLSITMFDLLGKQVFTQSLGAAQTGEVNERISLENFAQGTYMLLVKTASGVAVRKVVVE
jgi:hypothetical protein